MAEGPASGESDGEDQLLEGRLDSVVDRCVHGDVVVAASEVLDKRVTGSKDPGLIGRS